MTRTLSHARRRRRASLALALTTTAATAVALPATAAPALAADLGWQPTAALTSFGKDALNPRVVRAEDGSATAIWTRSVDDSLATNAVQVASRPLGGAWSEPLAISPTDQQVADARIAIGVDGTVAASWSQRPNRTRPWQGVVSVKRPGGAWSEPASFVTDPADEATTPSTVVAPDGTVTAAWTRVGSDERAHVEVARSLVAGGWETPRELTATPDADEPKIARGADGTLALTWLDRDAGSGNYTVWGAVAPGGGDWQPRQLLSDAARYSYGSPQLVVGATGDTTVVFQTRTDNARYARYQAVSASWSAQEGWSAYQEAITPDDRTVTAQDPNVAIDAAGNVTAAFLKTDYDGDDAAGVRATVDNVQVATRAAGTRAWSTPETIAQEVPNATLRDVTVAVAANGAAAVGWTGYVDAVRTGRVVRVATRTAGTDGWSAPAQLSGTGAPTLSSQMTWTVSLAADSLGAFSAAWHINDDASRTQVQVADYEVERPAPVVPGPDPQPQPAPAPQPTPPAPQPTPPAVQQPVKPGARRAAAKKPLRLKLGWRGKRLVVRVANAPAKARLRVVVGSGRKARAFTARGGVLTLPAKQSRPRGRLVVRLSDAKGKRLKSFTTRAPKRPTSASKR